ncbi:HFL302Wp [Eremothecium sinecaudum]|uniref:carnosine N-methyltransferase n=1 Tax=Eremothecium sinecaudum TaxID=45286 RepID=A0A0X8HU57_9SACH|nr:HFL302Wp [Eremothecium sinecaudum]AMD21554.1 HFL302Wp [Eremothecium sinecaudum]
MTNSDSAALEQTLSSFLGYREYALDTYWRPRFKRWQSLTEYQQQLIPWYADYLDQVHEAVICNAVFYEEMLSQAVIDWEIDKSPMQWSKPTITDMEKTVSIFSQLVREWSQECNHERLVLLKRLESFFNSTYPKSIRSNVNVLVPGAGLGRLVVDIVKLGFNTEGNELSYHMLLISRYLLNGGLQKNQLTIYPFIHIFGNHLNRESQLTGVNIPDVSVADELGGNNLMSMSAGSFVDIYGPNIHIKQSGYYSNTPEMRLQRGTNSKSKDVVITCFFIDTANNILDYIETIHNVLKPGGYWINFGPLLYHFENDVHEEQTCEFDSLTGAISNVRLEPVKGLELSLEDILLVSTTKFGFIIIDQEIRIESGYGKANSRSTSDSKYQCNYWIMRK